MSSMINLSVLQNNDAKINLYVTYQPENLWIPLPLTGITPSFVLKASQTATDASGTTYTVGNGLTILSSRLGQIQASIPKTSLATAGSMWYRLDLTSAANGDQTAIYGNLYILAA